VTLVTILAAIVALCVVIIIHEFGHYIAAVATGMKVDRFSVFGIGPPILRLGTWRGTEFVISAIPFGAYVLIRGMEADDGTTPPEDRATSLNFRDKPLWSRMVVIAGGPIANYIGAFLLCLGLFAIAGMPGPTEQAYAIEITQVNDDSSAEAAGIEPGDRLLAIGGTEIDPKRGSEGVIAATQAHRGTDVVIAVDRDGERLELPASLPDKAEGVLGIGMDVLAPRQPVPFSQAAHAAVLFPVVNSREQLVGIWELVTAKREGTVSGPVDIVGHIKKAADRGWPPFIEMTALISTLLGLFNLLPLPALDGGRLAFLFYEGIARRRASPRVEELVHGYGMVALLGLLLIVTIGDVRRLIS
jgi:regulator of sigma E protease